jgi:predicted KAP-like P-loop ATPase
MNEQNLFNDAPILRPEDDRFGIEPFARALSASIRGMNAPVGSTIALNGPWGSGKSSAVNLIRHHLMEDVKAGKIEIIDFKCWWFRGEEALTLAFFQQLHASLQKNLKDKAKDLIPRLGKNLLQAGPVLGSAVNLYTGGLFGNVISGSFDFAKRFFSESEPIEDIFQDLSEALREQHKRFLILIDDIDRLTSNEALLMFRLVKSVGRLPNVIYLLVFDRRMAEKAVNEVYPSEGPHYLEKIIQASFDLPLPARDDLNRAMFAHIETLCGSQKDGKRQVRFMNVYYDAIAPYINTPRDVSRLANAISISWPPVANEVDMADFVALETMRLFEASLHNEIRLSGERLCGTRSSFGSHHDDSDKEMNELLDLVPEPRRPYARLALQRLFPRFEKVTYSDGTVAEWAAHRLVCSDRHFDTYFRMGLGDDTISLREVETLIRHSGDSAYVKSALQKAAYSIRKNGKSKIPLLFDELNVHAFEIEKANFQPLITALFESADDIYRPQDQESGLAIGDTHLRIHWLIRKLTYERCTLEERSTVFMTACRSAQIGWLADFTHSALDDHFPRDGKMPTADEKCLVTKEAIPELKNITLNAILAASADGRLIAHRQLPHILYLWKQLTGEVGGGVLDWTKKQFEDIEATSILAQAFTGETRSHSLGFSGLGDRVVMRTPKASIDGLERIMDVQQFRQRLEDLENNPALSEQQGERISTFLNAWRRREKKA